MAETLDTTINHHLQMRLKGLFKSYSLAHLFLKPQMSNNGDYQGSSPWDTPHNSTSTTVWHGRLMFKLIQNENLYTTVCFYVTEVPVYTVWYQKLHSNSEPATFHSLVVFHDLAKCPNKSLSNVVFKCVRQPLKLKIICMRRSFAENCNHTF